MQLVEEMFLSIGLRFSSATEVRDKIRSVQNQWDIALCPAIVEFAVESGRYQPESDNRNGKEAACFLIIIMMGIQNYNSAYDVLS